MVCRPHEGEKSTWRRKARGPSSEPWRREREREEFRVSVTDVREGSQGARWNAYQAIILQDKKVSYFKGCLDVPKWGCDFVVSLAHRRSLFAFQKGEDSILWNKRLYWKTSSSSDTGWDDDEAQEAKRYFSAHFTKPDGKTSCDSPFFLVNSEVLACLKGTKNSGRDHKWGSL